VCDGKDGLVDGIVTDPRACEFDPAVLQCKDNEGDGQCLSPSQVKAARAVYAGTKNSRGETVSYPLSRGSELSWARFIATGSAATPENWLKGNGRGGLRGGLSPRFWDSN